MNSNQTQDPEILVTDDEIQQLKQCLPKTPALGINEIQMLKYHGHWCFDHHLRNILKFQRHFQARDTDIFIMGLPKTGTTWLKSLLFATLNRADKPIDQSNLVTSHPQELVYSLEADLYADAFVYPRPHHLHELPSPRLFSTHLAYTSLPESIKAKKCVILYICRNPLDTYLSLYHFAIGVMKNRVGNDYQPPSFEDCLEDFDEERYPYGPFFEHVSEYWKMSMEHPDRVLFLKYEDLKDGPLHQLKRIASFVGMPFSPQEETEGVINQITEFCSIGNMKELKANKEGFINKVVDKQLYFRKGEVGKWTNYFKPSTVENITKSMQKKLKGTGLSFKLLPGVTIGDGNVLDLGLI